MIEPRLFRSLSLLAILLAACAPSTASTNPPVAGTEPPTVLAPTPTFIVSSPESPTEIVAATEAPADTLLPLATSRGPELHATDPAAVSLASGGLQFVEFFRFT